MKSCPYLSRSTDAHAVGWPAQLLIQVVRAGAGVEEHDMLAGAHLSMPDELQALPQAAVSAIRVAGKAGDLC